MSDVTKGDTGAPTSGPNLVSAAQDPLKQIQLTATPTIEIGQVKIDGDNDQAIIGTKTDATWDGAAAGPSWTAIFKYIGTKIEAVRAVLAGTLTVSTADGGNVAQGSKADATWDGAAAASGISIWRYIGVKLEAVRALLAGALTVQAAQGANVTATIAINQSLSGVIDLGVQRAARIVMPASWDSAALTFQTSYDGSAFSNLYDSTGTEYTVQAAAGRAIILPYADFVGARYLKIRSGASAAPVNQTAARSLIVVTQ